MNRPASDILTRREVADLFGVHPATVNKWVEKGFLSSFRTLGGQSRFHRAEVEALIVADSQKQTA
jgi:excisionase family DNA binding protein